MLHAVDIAKKTFMAGYFDAQNKLQIVKIQYTDEGIQEYINILSPDSHVVMEFTGNYEQRLAHELTKANIKVSILPGSTIRSYAKSQGMHNKTDKEDVKAMLIYAQKHPEKLHIYKINSEEIALTKQLRNLIQDLKKKLQAAKNQRDAHQLFPNASKVVSESYTRQIESLEEEITMATTEMDALNSKQVDFNRDIVLSIPGIGPKTTDEVQLLVNTTTDLSLETIPKFIKLTGLAPSSNESGSTVKGSRKISKGGFGQTRRNLYMAALGICTKSKEDSVFKDMYLRLRGKGKCFKVAITAVMGKLLKVILTLVVKNEMYDPQKYISSLAK